MGQSTIANAAIYIQAAAMASDTQFKFNVFSPNTNSLFSQKLHPRHLVGNIAVGLGFDFLCLYIGGELGAVVNTDSKHLNRRGVLFQSTQFTNHVAVKDRGYFDITPGFELTDLFLLYARVGVSQAKVTIAQDSTPGVSGFRNPSMQYGGRIGLGLNCRLCDLGIGLDYVATFYPRHTTLSPRATQYSVKTIKNMLGVHLRYYF